METFLPLGGAGRGGEPPTPVSHSPHAFPSSLPLWPKVAAGAPATEATGSVDPGTVCPFLTRSQGTGCCRGVGRLGGGHPHLLWVQTQGWWVSICQRARV